MSEKYEVHCDACGEDLTYTGNCVDYRLIVAAERKPIYPGAGAVTAMGLYPAVDRKHHFCGLGCLAKWMADNHPDAIDEYDGMMRHRAKMASRTNPPPPDTPSDTR